MARRTLSDAQWARIGALVPGRAGASGATGRDNRLLFMAAVLWLARPGAPRRALAHEFGHGNSGWRRFDRWPRAGVWGRLLEALAEDPAFEPVIIGATVVRAHQHAAGAQGGLRLKRSAAPAAA